MFASPVVLCKCYSHFTFCSAVALGYLCPYVFRFSFVQALPLRFGLVTCLPVYALGLAAVTKS